MRAHAAVPLSAIALIAGAVLCFSIMDATVKTLSQRYPILLLVWARYAIQAIAMVVWLFPQAGFTMMRTQHVGLHLVRGVVLSLSSVCFFSGLRYLPLGEATALNYATPVLVMVLAVAFLGERLTRPRIALLMAGLSGMLLIVRPGSAVFQTATLLVLASGMFYGIFQILTRKLASEDSRVMLLYPAVVGVSVMTALLPWYGLDEPPAVRDVAIIVALGLIGTLGHFMFILAFKRAPASALTPYTYVQLVWATLIGWIAFDNFPDAWSLAGMAVIAGSGLLIAMHERRRAKGVQEPTATE